MKTGLLLVIRRLTVTVAASAIAVTFAGTAHAAEQPVQLSAKPVTQSGPYFDLTMRPGETRRLKIALGNNGPKQVAARTYAADAYTIINGGFGAELRDGAASGTTTWLDYSGEVVNLPPGRAIERPVTVTVPRDAPAGEYLTSLVLENDEPVRGSGGIALDQVVRHVVAVAVRVPGPLRPGLALGDASHKHVAGRSVVAVEVSNTGNVRLTPAADLVVHDNAGSEVSRATVPMDSFYAGTATKVEITLATRLNDGSYTVDLDLHDDARKAHATAAGLPFTVAPPAVAADASSAARQVVDVVQNTMEQSPVAFVLVVALILTLIGLVAARLLTRRAPRARHARRRRSHAAA